MAARTSSTKALLAAVFTAFIVTCAVPGPSVCAQEIQPQVQNAKFQFSGIINAPAVPVYSGPSSNYYITSKLDKGAPVTVVGIKYEWLKIVPPEGSFSVVAKQLVNLEPDGKIGRINGSNVNIRAGSSLVPLKVTVQCKLQQGAVVEIIKEDDAYYQIKPPAEAYLYVHQKFVDPVKQVAGAVAEKPTPTIPDRVAEKPQQPIEPQQPEKIELVDANSLANTNLIELKSAPATRPVAPVAVESEFDRLEAEFIALTGKSLDEAPIPQLLAGYEKLLQNDHLPATMKRIATAKAASLKIKNSARAELLAMRKSEAESNAKLEALRGERDQIQQRIAEQVAFTAVGVLQPSTLQIGSQTLYRLTDPVSGRTLCYVRSNDARFGTFLEKFVGVKGELVSEAQLTVKALIATDVAAVDPADVTKKVTAVIIPPSLLAAKPAAPAAAPAPEVKSLEAPEAKAVEASTGTN